MDGQSYQRPYFWLSFCGRELCVRRKWVSEYVLALICVVSIYQEIACADISNLKPSFPDSEAYLRDIQQMAGCKFERFLLHVKAAMTESKQRNNRQHKLVSVVCIYRDDILTSLK